MTTIDVFGAWVIRTARYATALMSPDASLRLPSPPLLRYVTHLTARIVNHRARPQNWGGLPLSRDRAGARALGGIRSEVKGERRAKPVAEDMSGEGRPMLLALLHMRHDVVDPWVIQTARYATALMSPDASLRLPSPPLLRYVTHLTARIGHHRARPRKLFRRCIARDRAGARALGGPRSEVKGERRAKPVAEDMSGEGRPMPLPSRRRSHDVSGCWAKTATKDGRRMPLHSRRTGCPA